MSHKKKVYAAIVYQYYLFIDWVGGLNKKFIWLKVRNSKLHRVRAMHNEQELNISILSIKPSWYVHTTTKT